MPAKALLLPAFLLAEQAVHTRSVLYAPAGAKGFFGILFVSNKKYGNGPGRDTAARRKRSGEAAERCREAAAQSTRSVLPRMGQRLFFLLFVPNKK